MYSEVVKCVKRQDCYYKLTPGTSNETSINLSSDVLYLVLPHAERNTTYPITFTIFKEDFIKALCYIITKLPLFTTRSGSSEKIEFSFNLFYNELAIINSFFIEEKMDYSVELYYREDGRIYLKSLNYKTFNLRRYLIEENTTMHFILGKENKLRLQYSENPKESNKVINERLAVKDHILKDYIYKVVYLLNKTDGLASLEPYIKVISENIQLLKANHFRLTGMFIATSLRDLAARNNYGKKIRWFETQFTLNGYKVYLSTQWFGNGKYSLMFDDFMRLVDQCYGDKFRCSKNIDGEFELWEFIYQTELKYTPDASVSINPIKNIESFRLFLDKTTDLSSRTKTSYISILNRQSIANLCSKIIGYHINTLFVLTDIDYLHKIIKNSEFIDFDNKGHHQYSSAIKYYENYLLAVCSDVINK